MSNQPSDDSKPDSYHALVDKVLAGEITITIPPNVARQFYTHISNFEIRDKTGSSQLLPKFLIWFGLTIAPMLLFISIVLLFLSDGWGSIVYVVIGGMLWVVTAGFINPQPNGVFTTIMMSLAVICSGAIFLLNVDGSGFYLIIFIYISSIWFHRMTYVLAARLLSRLLLNSETAYDMLKEHIEFADADQ